MQSSYRLHKWIPLFFNSAKEILLFRRNISEQTDKELLQHYIKSSETEYFDELYNRHIPLLYGVCLRCLEDEARTQDTVMELFESLLPKVTHYEIKTFRTWIYRVAKNHCLQTLRKDSKEVPLDYTVYTVESDELLYLLCKEESNASQLETLHHCLKKPSGPRRVSIRHFFIEEMSYVDIVAQTGFTLNDVKSYIQNGKHNLEICVRDQLKE